VMPMIEDNQMWNPSACSQEFMVPVSATSA
jgi:hypothetical protein